MVSGQVRASVKPLRPSGQRRRLVLSADPRVRGRRAPAAGVVPALHAGSHATGLPVGLGAFAVLLLGQARDQAGEQAQHDVKRRVVFLLVGVPADGGEVARAIGQADVVQPPVACVDLACEPVHHPACLSGSTSWPPTM